MSEGKGLISFSEVLAVGVSQIGTTTVLSGVFTFKIKKRNYIFFIVLDNLQISFHICLKLKFIIN